MKLVRPLGAILLASVILVGCGNEESGEGRTASDTVVSEVAATDDGQASSVDITVSKQDTNSADQSGKAIGANKSVSAIRTFSDCSQCPEMVELPGGTFIMGAGEDEGYSQERPAHEVTIAAPFAIGKYEVTFEDWDACVADGGCDAYTPDDKGWGRGRQPVIGISRDDAWNYVDWLSEKTGKTYRLPTEAEWEYAARGGTQTLFWWGDEIGVGNAACWNCGSEWDRKQPAPVGSFKPNPFGLYDVAGNVFEWVEDCAADKGYDNTPADGTAMLDCSGNSWFGPDMAIIRGGAFGVNNTETDPNKMPERSAARLVTAGMERNFGNSMGMRVARDID